MTVRRKIIVTGSTYPRWKGDGVPMFLYDQLVSFRKLDPEMEIVTLVPHHAGARLREMQPHGELIRFRYFFPEKLQRLVYPAILPNLRESKLLYLQIPFLLFFEFIALLRLVRQRKPDVIYSHWFIPQGIVGAIVGTLTRTKHVYTSHSSDVQIAKKIPFLGRFLVRFCTNRTAKITVVSQRSYDKLRSFFSNESWASIEPRVKIIPMGVDTESFVQTSLSSQVIKKEFGYQDRTLLLFVGRLAEKKGVSYLLEAVKEYCQVDPTVLLIVAGDGPLLETLVGQAKELGLEQFVDFVGYTDGERKLRLFKICDVLVLPSIITDDGDAEGFPVVLMEGLAAGRICIATDVSGADDVLNSGVDGFVIKQRSSDDILQALVRAKELTAKERDRISANAIVKSRELDWSRVSRAHVEHLFND